MQKITKLQRLNIYNFSWQLQHIFFEHAKQISTLREKQVTSLTFFFVHVKHVLQTSSYCWLIWILLITSSSSSPSISDSHSQYLTCTKSSVTSGSMSLQSSSGILFYILLQPSYNIFFVFINFNTKTRKKKHTNFDRWHKTLTYLGQIRAHTHSPSASSILLV